MKKLITRNDGSNSEGIGSILQGILHLYAFCKINNLEFVCNKLTNISHYQYTDFDTNQFSEKLNNFFNLHTDNSEFDELMDPAWLILNWGEQFNKQKKPHIQELFKNITYDGPKFFDQNKVSLSVHIRNINNQDVCFDNRREYFSKEKKEYFKNIIRNVLETEKKDFDIHIFSQGNYEEFSEFVNEFGATIHLDNDTIETLYHLITSQYLITSNSSFSWISHLYGQNHKVYSRDNFFHSWYPETILVDYIGNIIQTN
jgi:hypothetical protein